MESGDNTIPGPNSDISNNKYAPMIPSWGLDARYYNVCSKTSDINIIMYNGKKIKHLRWYIQNRVQMGMYNKNYT